MSNLGLECPVCGNNIGIMEMPEFLDEARTFFCCRRCGRMKELIGTEPANARRYFAKYKPQEVISEKITSLFEKEGVLSPYEEGGELTEEEKNGTAISQEKASEPGDLAREIMGLKQKVNKLWAVLSVSIVLEVILIIYIILSLVK